MGVVSCNIHENAKQTEIHQEIRKQGNIVDQKELKSKKLPPKNNNKSNKNVFYNKINNNNLFNKNKNNDNKINQRRKTYIKKDVNHQNKETKLSLSKKKNRNTISHNYKINSKTLINDSRLKRNILNSSIKKKKEKKNNKINYNIYTNIYNDLSEEDKIINNNENDELDDNFNLINPNIIKVNNNQYKDLKEKLMKAKEQIIKIKKDLYNKDKSSVNNEINMSINKERLTTIEIYDKNLINSQINNSVDNINIRNKNIINNKINNIDNDNDNDINSKIDKNKINNTIYINNSNITISNNRTNNLSHDNLKEMKEKNIELNDLLTNVLNNNNENNIENINKQCRIQSNLDLNFLKRNNLEYLNETNNEIIDNDIKSDKNDKNEKIINKLTAIKMKINKEITPPKRRTYPVFESKKIKKFNTMNNKQIKNNIPSYRRGHSQSNTFYPSVLNSSTYDYKKKKLIIRRINIISTENSFNNRSLGSYNLKAKKKNINRYTINNKKGNSLKKLTEKNVGIINSISKKSLQQSYINESSISFTQNNKLNLNISKAKKNQRLYNFISKNIININSNNQNSSEEYEQLKVLSQNGDVIIIDLSPINLNVSLINKDFLKGNINNKIVLDYNKLESLSTSQIIYDGFIYKVVESKENGYKLIERYFQLLKNCFRYYNNLENAVANKDKPLVQFDIRHIKEINIINNNNDIFKKYKIKEKQIEFVFCIFLYQNDDFFVFACNNKEIGNSIFTIINLLKNYYAKK